LNIEYKSSILEQRVQTEGVIAALRGQQGTQIIRDYRNVEVLSSYAPLKVEGLSWGILSEMDLAEAYAPVTDFARRVLISATLMMLLLTILAIARAQAAN
jgi:hypothetical protein